MESFSLFPVVSIPVFENPECEDPTKTYGFLITSNVLLGKMLGDEFKKNVDSPLTRQSGTLPPSLSVPLWTNI